MPNDLIETDVLEQDFSDVIKAMDKHFTTHQFFLRLAHDHQRAYVAGWQRVLREEIRSEAHTMHR